FISACVIPHLWHMVQGAYYERQGGQHTRKHLYELIGTTARHRHYGGSVSEHAHWGVTPTADIITGDTFSMGGGHAHCGLTIYRGDNFPEPYRNGLLMFNLHGHRINWDHAERQGSGYYGDRRPDILFTNDHWFVGTHLDYGPDGALYFTDWHDDTTCHRQSDLEWDRTNGRLFRVHYGEHQPVKVDLGEATDLELASYQTHRNEWYAKTARRLLQERAVGGAIDRNAVDALWTLVGGANVHDDVPIKLRALWTLHGIGAARELLPGIATKGDSEYVRAWAIRLLGEQPNEITTDFAGLAKAETSPFVRRHFASLLQRLTPAQAWPIAEALAGHGEDADDELLPKLLWYGLEPLVAKDPARGFALAKATPIAKLRQFIFRRIAAIPGGYETALSQIEDPATAEVVVTALAAQLKDEAKVPMPSSWPKVYDLLKDKAKPEIRTHLLTLAGKFGDTRLLPEFRQLLNDVKQSESLRQTALQTLLTARDPKLVPILHQLVNGPENPLREQAIPALATLQTKDTAGILIEAYARLSSPEKASVITTLTGRQASAQALLEAIGANRIPRNDLSVVAARQVLQFRDPSLKALLEKHWGSFAPTSNDKQALMTQWRERLTPEHLAQANLSHGRQLFNQTCHACHALFGQGTSLGPDITGANRSDLNYLLENILAPNNMVPLDYQLVVFTLKDNSVVSGMIRKEGETAFTVALPGGTETTVAKAEIATRETLTQSLMPEGILDAMSTTDARDLIAYLQSDKQVRLAQPGEILFEGEHMKVLKKTGNTSSQAMNSYTADQWSGDAQLWWTGARPGDTLVLDFEAPQEGTYTLATVFTKAVDYGKVRVSLDSETNFILEEVDLYDTRVNTTGELTLGQHALTAGKHRLIINVLGKHPKAASGYMFGIDYLLLVLNDRE
ncbi:MAG: putative heme-binding domain-containing protein, partial [Verrucomicrobiales bacterium]